MRALFRASFVLPVALYLSALAGAAQAQDQAQGQAAPPAPVAPDQAPPSAAAEASADLSAQTAPSPTAAEAPANASNGVYPPPDRYATSSVEEDPVTLESRPGSREHEGVFVRLQLGPGAARTRYKERVDGVRRADVQTTGLSGSFDLAVGGRVVGNLILHASLAYARFRSDIRRVDGVKDAALKVSSTALNLGGGLTYYFMPYNVFLTGSVGAAWLIESRPDGQVRSKTGFCLLAAAGKEWWVGPRGDWGLGAALRFTFAAAGVDIGGVANTLKFADLSLAFSATFN